MMLKTLYNWLSDNKPVTKSTIDVEQTSPSKENKILYGVNLEDWNYLGNSVARYMEKTKVTSTCDVHFFENKDETKRKWVLVGPSWKLESFKHHTFIEKQCELWRIGELGHYDVIFNYHSDRLINYMATKWDVPYKWNKQSKRWVQDSVKMQKKAAASKKIKITKEDDSPEANNVVSVEFGKKDD